MPCRRRRQVIIVVHNTCKLPTCRIQCRRRSRRLCRSRPLTISITKRSRCGHLVRPLLRRRRLLLFAQRCPHLVRPRRGLRLRGPVGLPGRDQDRGKSKRSDQRTTSRIKKCIAISVLTRGQGLDPGLAHARYPDRTLNLLRAHSRVHAPYSDLRQRPVNVARLVE